MRTVMAGFGVVLLTLAGARTYAAQDAKSVNNNRTLKVQLHYTGNGKVDEKHKIFVFVFDTPDFTHGDAAPVDTHEAVGKDEEVTFSNVSQSPVYAALIYDPNGEYDGQSAPPSGVTVAMYSKTPGVPEPISIDSGKAVEVTIAFDDSHKL